MDIFHTELTCSLCIHGHKLLWSTRSHSALDRVTDFFPMVFLPIKLRGEAHIATYFCGIQFTEKRRIRATTRQVAFHSTE